MSAEFGACVFDVTLDCEDGAPVGGEAEHAAQVAELVLGAAPGARVAARVHPVDHPAFELVGVGVSNPAKVGVDVGTVCGLGREVGVRCTDSVEDLVALREAKAGIEGAIIGRALYDGRIDPKAALAAAA